MWRSPLETLSPSPGSRPRPRPQESREEMRVVGKEMTRISILWRKQSNSRETIPVKPPILNQLLYLNCVDIRFLSAKEHGTTFRDTVIGATYFVNNAVERYRYI